MLFHNFFYTLKGIIREKTSIFWAGLFPFLLGTMFYVSFGTVYEKAESFHEIPVAFVEGTKNEESDYFLQILESLEDETGTKMFKITELSEEKAKSALEKKKIDGYYLADETFSLIIAENGTNQTILNLFLEQYLQQSAMIKDVLKNNPAKLEAMTAALSENLTYYTEVNQTTGNMDPMSQYFYALIAMSCLFGSYLSLERAKRLQANITMLGARRGVAPIRKSTVIVSEFASCVLIQFLISCALLVYLMGICKLDLGDRIGHMLLTVVVGSAFGIALGFCVGSIGKISESMRQGINVLISLGLSFLSGLMVHIIKQLLEEHAPIINRINPATLIVDSLYALNVYETTERYWRNMITLTILTLALCIASIISIRRTRYASI